MTTDSAVTQEELNAANVQLEDGEYDADINSPDPVEHAAALFAMYTDRFRMLTRKLSSKQLRRCIQLAVLEPLEHLGVKCQTPEEQDYKALIDAMLQAKYLMLLHVGVQEQERIERERLAKELTSETQEAATDSQQQTAVIEEGTQNG